MDEQSNAELVKTNLVEKWSNYLDGCLDKKDEINLAILLDNCAKSREFAVDPVFTMDEALELTKQAWLKCRFRKMVSIQAMMQPVGLVFYTQESGLNTILTSDAVPARTKLYDFKIFPDVKFEYVKNSYVISMAQNLEFFILDMLKPTHTCSMEALSDCMAINPNIDLRESFDYLIVPKSLLKRMSGLKVDVYGVSDSYLFEDMTLNAICGKYPVSNLTAPIFCPYILFQEGPCSLYHAQDVAMRIGKFEKPCSQ